ncbi:MAG: hypothetical protein Q9172_002129 [Xanthocarpia lactea]
MAWGEKKCVLCDEIVNSDGTSICKCPERITYRKQPERPASAMRLYHNARGDRNDFQAAFNAFKALPSEERRCWETKATADRARFEREKMEYNDTIPLDDESLSEDEMNWSNDVADMVQALRRRRGQQQWARYRRDHKNFNRHSLEKAQDQDSPPAKFHRFGDLPPEIRAQIYAHLFRQRRSTGDLRHWQLEFESAGTDADLGFTHFEPLDTRILAVSRQVYTEALEVLYSSRCFIVDIALASVPPLFVQKASGNLPPRPTSKIRRWHIRVNFTNILHRDYILPQLQLVHDVMKECSCLDTVRFSWLSVPEYWREVSALRGEMDGMLSIFKDLRGVHEVLFTELSDADKARRKIMMLGGWNNMYLPSEDVRRDIKASMESAKC